MSRRPREGTREGFQDKAVPGHEGFTCRVYDVDGAEVLAPQGASPIQIKEAALSAGRDQRYPVAFTVTVEGQEVRLNISWPEQEKFTILPITRDAASLNIGALAKELGVEERQIGQTQGSASTVKLGDGPQMHRGPLLVPGKTPLYIPDGALVHEEGRLIYGGSVQGANESLRAKLLAQIASPDVAIPPFADRHVHAFQPWWNPEELLSPREGQGGFDGSLPPTLRFETQIKENPEQAQAIAHELIETMIANGTGEAVVYGTSSLGAMEALLEAGKAFGSHFKTGFVFMDQDVNFIEGVRLEVNQNEVEDILRRIKVLAQQYPGSITIIDRFPIAVRSPLRKRLVQFCIENNLEYDTHANESQGEAGRTAQLYDERRILEVLKADGVFQPGMKPRLAHMIHQNEADWQIIQEAIQAGVPLEVVACPASNGYLESPKWDGQVVGFPFQALVDAGVRVSFGTDAGAGLVQNIASVAVHEMTRHHQGPRPTWAQVFKSATSQEANLQTGAPADWITVRPSQTSFQQELDPEVMVRRVLVAAQNGANITSMVLGGKRLR